MNDGHEPISQAGKRKNRRPNYPDVHLPATFNELAHKPINQLVAILPFLIVFHVGSLLTGNSLLMPRYIQAALEWIGLDIPFFTAGVIIIVLLCQQIMHHQPWKINWLTICRIYIESVLWILPLVALAWLTTSLNPATILPDKESHSMQIFRSAMEAVGAGVYEEFVFRLVLLQGLILLFVDIFRNEKLTMTIVSISIVAILFAACHFTMQQLFESETMHWSRAIFLLLAGFMWGVLAVWKGYAMAALSHVWWNLLVLFWTLKAAG